MEKAFEEYLKKTNLSENTKKSYQTAVKQFFGMYMTVDNSNLRSYKTHEYSGAFWFFRNYP